MNVASNTSAVQAAVRATSASTGTQQQAAASLLKRTLDDQKQMSEQLMAQTQLKGQHLDIRA
jgi:hypothetical protein